MDSVLCEHKSCFMETTNNGKWKGEYFRMKKMEMRGKVHTYTTLSLRVKQKCCAMETTKRYIFNTHIRQQFVCLSLYLSFSRFLSFYMYVYASYLNHFMYKDSIWLFDIGNENPQLKRSIILLSLNRSRCSHLSLFHSFFMLLCLPIRTPIYEPLYRRTAFSLLYACIVLCLLCTNAQCIVPISSYSFSFFIADRIRNCEMKAWLVDFFARHQRRPFHCQIQ